MQWSRTIFRSLVYPGPFYREGPTHVIPLMLATLPGIDPNDMRKSMTTFQFISTFATLVPIVDSSRAHEFHKGKIDFKAYVLFQDGYEYKFRRLTNTFLTKR
jgi:hypothetical protein